MSKLILADTQYERVLVDTTLAPVTAKQYAIKNGHTASITITYGVDTLSLSPDAVAVLIYDGVDWALMTVDVTFTELNPTFDSIDVTGTTYVGGSILQKINTSSINIAPGTVTNLGGNITLFGGSHSVYPDRIQFRNGSNINMLIDNTAINLLKPTTILGVAQAIGVPYNTYISKLASGTGALTDINLYSGITTSYGWMQVMKPTVGYNALMLNPIAGEVVVGSANNNGTDLLQVGSNTDISASIGRGRLGFSTGGSIDDFYIGHYDHFTSTNYGIRIVETGYLALNAPSGESVVIRNNNANVASFSGLAISLLKPVSVTAETITLNTFSQIKMDTTTREFSFYNIDSNILSTIGWDMNSGGRARRMTLTQPGRLILSGTDNGTDLLQVGADTDISASMGKLKIFSASADFAGLAHYDHANGNDYAIALSSLAATIVNAASGQVVTIRNNGITDIATFSGTAINLLKDTIITGSLSKSSGSFRIPHPLPEKEKTHQLVHSFVEAPQADNIYRGKVKLTKGKARVNIDLVANMTEGTFTALNREVQIFTTNESGWNMVKGSVEGNIVTIESQTPCTDLISWMVIGERKDKHMYDTAWTDEDGKVIVEPEIKEETKE